MCIDKMDKTATINIEEINTKKVLFDVLKRLKVIKDNDSWELKIGGNRDGIRWYEYSERYK